MKRLTFLSIFFVLTFSLFADDGILFQFRHKKGDAVSHIATVEEEAYLNGQLHNQTQFINRTSTTVTETQKDGSANLFTHYMTTQNNFFQETGKMLSWGEEESVRLYRDKNGHWFFNTEF